MWHQVPGGESLVFWPEQAHSELLLNAHEIVQHAMAVQVACSGSVSHTALAPLTSSSLMAGPGGGDLPRDCGQAAAGCSLAEAAREPGQLPALA